MSGALDALITKSENTKNHKKNELTVVANGVRFVSKTKRKYEEEFVGHNWQWYVLSDFDENRFRELYASNCTMQDIAHILRMSCSRARYFRLKFGLKDRFVPSAYRLTLEQEQEFRKLHAKGVNAKVLGEKFGRSRSAIIRLVKRLGLPTVRQSKKSDRHELSVYLSKKERDMLFKIAQKAGISASQYTRNMIKDAIDGKIEV